MGLRGIYLIKSSLTLLFQRGEPNNDNIGNDLDLSGFKNLKGLNLANNEKFGYQLKPGHSRDLTVRPELVEG